MTPQQKYNASHTKAYSLRLNYLTDGFIIDMLDNSGNAQGLVKRALMEYYDNHKLYDQNGNDDYKKRLRTTLSDAEKVTEAIRAIINEITEKEI